MLPQESLDVVHICLLHYLHTKVSAYAIERGVNVLCEKPMAIDYESAKAVVELAKKKSVQYGVIFQCRYNDAAQFVKERLSGSLIQREN